MSETSIKDAFSSKLVLEAEDAMGQVETRVFGMSSNQSYLDQAKEMIASLMKVVEDCGDNRQEIDKWFKKNAQKLELLTRTLPMSDLKDVFAKLEKSLSDETFDSFFEFSEISDSRRKYLSKLVANNLMFSPPFVERVGKSIASMKAYGFDLEA